MPRKGLAEKTITLMIEARDVLAVIQPASVRAVCYKLFVAGHIPDMGKNSTSRVSRALVTARERGFIPWAWIVDEGRALERQPSWDDPVQFVEAVKRSYRKDYWAAQPRNVIVVSEKGTVRGSIQPALDEFGVAFVALHGFSSATTFNDIARMSAEDPRETHFLYIGDFDPSGMYMSQEDIFERMARYGGRGYVSRIAVTGRDRDTMPDDLTFSARTRQTDSRYPWFAKHYGDRCVELDALDPRELRERVTAAIRERIDWDEWNRAIVAEDAETKSIEGFVTDWQNLFRGRPQNNPEAA